ncbi:metallopeptidase family protein [Citreicella sp. C3M06]|uniref:metallopeptidase family protein n=1 Tax=Roseobacteraceae TaxID=2854170 RepID=UPI001C09506D|nr:MULTISPECIES: metallopeptidase family protein [Roseobacteraceae]MBU2959422.1 metallopeptidase family protein [Citreicella sp. C3M06]MDO6585674.1 metallopeptidase family protein [Salipiger sp. 1_MG-2023]
MSRHGPEQIETIARNTVEGFPEPFRSGAQDVLIEVVEWPPADVLAELGIRDPRDLTGLYEGVPVTERSVSDPVTWPDRVTLYRQPILTELRERGNVTLEELVSHITVHEFAHHFGWSDDDIASVDEWWL